MRTFCALFALTVAAMTCAGCTSSVDQGLPIEADDPTIEFRAMGGIAGVDERLTIDPDGLAVDDTMYPPLALQLTHAELEEILTMLNGFDNYKEEYRQTVMDGFQFSISLRTGDRRKSVVIDDAAFEKHRELSQLSRLVGTLMRLRTRLFQEKCQWVGLEYRFFLDSAVYHAGSPMTISCVVNNPTLAMRTLYFRNKHHVQFHCWGDAANPTISATIPEYYAFWADTSSPHQISIAPGQAVTLSMTWNQTFVVGADMVFRALPVGSYSATIAIPAGSRQYTRYAAAWDIKFTIIR